MAYKNFIIFCLKLIIILCYVHLSYNIISVLITTSQMYSAHNKYQKAKHWVLISVFKFPNKFMPLPYILNNISTIIWIPSLSFCQVYSNFHIVVLIVVMVVVLAELIMVLNCLSPFHNSTLSPVTVAAPLLTVFSAQIAVSFSTAWRC